MSTWASAFVVAVTALATATSATSARAQVAVAVTLAEDDASQRDIAARVVSVARKAWDMQSPQLTSEATKSCAAGDTECLRNLAKAAKATHLLVIGVAPLGVRDRVVAVQLFAVDNPGPLFEESVVQAGLTDDLPDVRALSSRLIAVKGPPPYVEPPVFVAPVPEPQNDLGMLSIGGMVLIGAGAATALASLGVGIYQIEKTDPEPANAQGTLLFGIAAGGLISGLGAAAVFVDHF